MFTQVLVILKTKIVNCDNNLGKYLTSWLTAVGVGFGEDGGGGGDNDDDGKRMTGL